LAEAAEFALGEEVYLDVEDDDARVALAFAAFKGPEFFAGFVGDGDGFAFPRDERAPGIGSFDQDGEAFGWGVLCCAHVVERVYQSLVTSSPTPGS